MAIADLHFLNLGKMLLVRSLLLLDICLFLSKLGCDRLQFRCFGGQLLSERRQFCVELSLLLFELLGQLLCLELHVGLQEGQLQLLLLRVYGTPAS